MSEIDEIKHRHRILEAIDQLRRRKARPDVNRICSFMFRRFSVSCGETKADLQKLIDAEIVIKVDYKGNTSYRNAAKWAMLPNYKSKQELDSSNTSSILTSAVAELIVLEPDYLDIGVPALELEKHLLKKDSRRFTKKNLDTILKREIDNGTLVKLENGNYFLGEHSNVTKQNNQSNSSRSVNKSTVPKPKTKKTKTKPVEVLPPPDAVQAADNSSLEDSKEEQKEKMDENGGISNCNASNSENVGFRVGGRQKRAKVMFDPSDNNLPKVSRKKQQGRSTINLVKNVTSINRAVNGPIGTPNMIRMPTIIPTPGVPVILSGPVMSPVKVSFNNLPTQNSTLSSTSTTVCCLCHAYGLRTKGVPERLVNCSGCTNYKAHPACIESRRQNAAYKNKNAPWLCLDCTLCSICRETGKVGKIAVCSLCGDAYHYICHTPHIPLQMVGMEEWGCAKCYTLNNSDEPLPLSSVPVIKLESCKINEEEFKMNEEDLIEEIEEEEEEIEEKPVISNIVAPSQSSGTSILINTTCTPSLSSLPIVTAAPSIILSSPVPSDTVNRPTPTNPPIATSNTSSTIMNTDLRTLTVSLNTIVSPSEDSTLVCPKNDAAMDIDEQDVPEVKPFIQTPNDYTRESGKENIKKTFIIPLTNGSNRMSAHEKGLVPQSCIKDPYDGYPIDETVPDAAMWSPHEVSQYFVKYFDQEIAKIFKEQEIDGQSLLLMKRTDVLTGLCLKLGPALKVYSHVKKLQIRRSHPKLLWS